jgi:hypothetical protein
MKNRILTIISVVALTIPAISLGQLSIPADIKAKMNGYVGVWEFSEETLQTPSSDPVEVSGEWVVRWIYDSLIEWRGTFIAAESKFTTVEFEGYDSQNQGFTYWFTSHGLRGNLYDGVWDGNTISFQEKSVAPDGSTTRSRCKFSYSDNFTKIDYTCDQYTDGAWWTSRRGSARKK